jgi:hypothetical protein
MALRGSSRPLGTTSLASGAGALETGLLVGLSEIGLLGMWRTCGEGLAGVARDARREELEPVFAFFCFFMIRTALSSSSPSPISSDRRATERR